jgi:hypothetical protein
VETELLVEALSSIFTSLVNIEYLPFLLLSSVSSCNLNCRSFSISSSSYIKNLVISPVNEFTVLILEDLPPIRVSTPDSHCWVSTVIGDVEGLVVVSSSDGQGLLMEVPFLSSSTVWCLDYNISIVDDIKVSIIW